MKLPDGVEEAIVLGLDDDNYLHVLSKMDSVETTIMVLQDALEMLLEEIDREDFTLQ